jgi:hypothetical protein
MSTIGSPICILCKAPVGGSRIYGEAEISRAAPQPPSQPVATDKEQEVQRKNECPPGTS